MATDPLTTTVLDLDAALGGNADLLVGGGFGLYLKQLHLERSDEKTLLPRSRWPRARTTQDIDLFLRAEIIIDAGRMASYRQAIDQLGFVVSWRRRSNVGTSESSRRDPPGCTHVPRTTHLKWSMIRCVCQSVTKIASAMSWSRKRSLSHS
jgi:hypothetical protein